MRYIQSIVSESATSDKRRKMPACWTETDIYVCLRVRCLKQQTVLSRRIQVRYDESQHIGVWIRKHIHSRYPFLTPEEAALAFLDFIPDDYHLSYEEHRRSYGEVFLRAHICSLLERNPQMALQNIAPIIRKNTLSDIRVALMNNDLPLHFDDRDMVMDIIGAAILEFESALEAIAETREDAKMVFIHIVSRKGRKEAVRPIAA